jgi:hypothetical protein
MAKLKYGALLVFVLGASFVLTACGGGGNTLNATLSDAGLTPKTFTVPVGAHVTFTVKNTRTDERDCIFRDLTTIKLYPGQSQWALVQIAAGTTKSLAFIAPSQPASYQIDCGLEGFSGQPRQPATGMVATLVVK